MPNLSATGFSQSTNYPMNRPGFFKILRTALMVVFVFSGFIGSAQRNNTFLHSYGGSQIDFGGSLLSLPDKGFIITGYTNSYGAGNYDLLVIRTDSLGRKIWSKVYGGSGNEGDILYYIKPSLDLTLSGDTNIVIVSNTESYGSGGKDVYLLKLDLNGNVKWTRTYGGSGNDIGIGITPVPGGGYLLIGQTFSYGAGKGDILLIKTNDTGGVIWSKTYGISADEEAGYRIIPTIDGNYLIVGYSYTTAGAYDHLLMKVDKSGNLRWSKTYGAASYDPPNDILELPDKSIYISGYTYNVSTSTGLGVLSKFDSLGNLKWSKVYAPGSLRTMHYDSKKNAIECFGTGTFSGYGQQRDFMARFDTSGNVKLMKSYGPTSTTSGYSMGQGHLMTALPNGGFAALGAESTFGAGNNDFFLIKTDSALNAGASCYMITHALSPSKWIFANNSYTLSTGSVTPGVSKGVITANAAVSENALCPPFVGGFGFTSGCPGQPIQFNDSTYSGPKTWNWNFGDASSGSNTSTLQNPMHTYKGAGTYQVKLVVSNGTQQDSIIRIVVVNAPKAIFTVGATCAGDSTKISNKSTGDSYTWSFGDGDTAQAVNPLHTYKKGGLYKITLFAINVSGCTDSVSHMVFIDSACVWPGDAWHERKADVKDVLPIGIAYGKTGTTRANASLNWFGQPSFDWNKTFKSGANYKHADCNGDGVIDSTDLGAITKNYGLSHSKTSEVTAGSPTDPPLDITFNKDSVATGDTVLAYINLGSDAIKVNNMYGIAFSVNYISKNTPKSISADFSKSWLGTPKISMITLVHNDTSNHQVDIGMSRNDLKTVSGSGQIGVLSIVMPDNLAGKTSLREIVHFVISDYKAIDNSENNITLNRIDDSIIVYQKKSGIDNGFISENDVKLFPNPAHDKLNITVNGYKISRTVITDILGKIVYTKNISNQDFMQIPTSALTNGVYCIEITTNNGIARARFVKE
jgi:PKD repeat protein